MSNLLFQKFKSKLHERRYIGPEGPKEYKKLSPKMRVAIRDVYSIIDKTPDPIISKIDGIINTVAKKHNIKVDDIENYFDNELIK
jgi:hypothetical protein